MMALVTATTVAKGDPGVSLAVTVAANSDTASSFCLFVCMEVLFA